MQAPKGYPVNHGWMGWVAAQHRWMLFATESEYLEYISDR